MNRNIKIAFWALLTFFIMSCLVFNNEDPTFQDEDTSSIDDLEARISEIKETYLYSIDCSDMDTFPLNLKVSPDGRRLGFLAKYSDGKEAFLFDGIGSKYDEVQAGPANFSFSKDMICRKSARSVCGRCHSLLWR